MLRTILDTTDPSATSPWPSFALAGAPFDAPLQAMMAAAAAAAAAAHRGAASGALPATAAGTAGEATALAVAGVGVGVGVPKGHPCKSPNPSAVGAAAAAAPGAGRTAARHLSLEKQAAVALAAECISSSVSGATSSCECDEGAQGDGEASEREPLVAGGDQRWQRELGGHGVHQLGTRRHSVTGAFPVSCTADEDVVEYEFGQQQYGAAGAGGAFQQWHAPGLDGGDQQGAGMVWARARARVRATSPLQSSLSGGVAMPMVPPAGAAVGAPVAFAGGAGVDGYRRRASGAVNVALTGEGAATAEAVLLPVAVVAAQRWPHSPRVRGLGAAAAGGGAEGASGLVGRRGARGGSGVRARGSILERLEALSRRLGSSGRQGGALAGGVRGGSGGASVGGPSVAVTGSLPEGPASMWIG